MAKSDQWKRDQKKHYQKKRQAATIHKLINKSCRTKKSYTTERSADAWATKWRRQGSPVLYVYECEWCGSWHLTKKARG